MQILFKNRGERDVKNVREWDDPEERDGKGGERRGSGWGTPVHPWLIHVNVWQKPLQYCKVITSN